MWPLETLINWPKVKVTVFTWKSENIHLAIFDNISDTIYSTVVTHGWKVACEESLKMIWSLVTLNFGQGHSIYWKFGKYPLFDNFWQYDIDIIHSKVMIFGREVACVETFKMMWHWMTLTFGQGHSSYWKFGNYPFLTRSQTLFTVELWDFTNRLPVWKPSNGCGIGWPWPNVKVMVVTWKFKNFHF